MRRRDFVKTGAGLSFVGAVGRGARAAEPAPNTPTPFDDTTVKQIAQKLAKSDYNPPSEHLPSAIHDLNFDQFRGIAFRPERALWHGENLNFDI